MDVKKTLMNLSFVDFLVAILLTLCGVIVYYYSSNDHNEEESPYENN